MRDALSSKNIETLREIEVRLLRLVTQYNELLEINSQLMEWNSFQTRYRFDSDSDTITIGMIDKEFKIHIKRANPNVPISLISTSSGGAYKAGSETNNPTHIAKLKSHMESVLEDYYHCAHRIQKLVKTLPGISNAESRAITIVRNKLVEHPDVGDFYSFGWSSNGPVVRPMHRPGLKWVDEGLIPNTKDFASVIIKAFS